MQTSKERQAEFEKDWLELLEKHSAEAEVWAEATGIDIFLQEILDENGVVLKKRSVFTLQ